MTEPKKVTMSETMRDIWPDIETKLSPEAVTDLRRLSTDHAINAALIHSLTASKKEAREHLKFFKRMMIISNGTIMFLGLTLAGFGLLRLLNDFSILGLICAIIGTLLFLKSASVFASMTRALSETKAVAQKHHLI